MSESSDVLSKFLVETPEETETVTLTMADWQATVRFRAQLILMIDEARALLRVAKADVQKIDDGSGKSKIITTNSWAKARSAWAKKADPLIAAVKKDIEGKKG